MKNDTKPVRYMENEPSMTGQMGGWLFRKGNKARHPVYGNVVVVSSYANSWFDDIVTIQREYSTKNVTVTVRSSELIVEEEKVSNFGDDKSFGVAQKSPNQNVKLNLSANNVKDRSKGVYVSLDDGRDYAFGRFDVDLIPSIIEHLQGIYDGFPKEKTTREKLLDLPSGSHFRDTRFINSAEYVKLGSHFFRVSDGMELPITNWTSSYEFEVIK